MPHVHPPCIVLQTSAAREVASRRRRRELASGRTGFARSSPRVRASLPAIWTRSCSTHRSNLPSALLRAEWSEDALEGARLEARPPRHGVAAAPASLNLHARAARAARSGAGALTLGSNVLLSSPRWLLDQLLYALGPTRAAREPAIPQPASRCGGRTRPLATARRALPSQSAPPARSDSHDVERAACALTQRCACLPAVGFRSRIDGPRVCTCGPPCPPAPARAIRRGAALSSGNPSYALEQAIELPQSVRRPRLRTRALPLWAPLSPARLRPVTQPYVLFQRARASPTAHGR